MRFFLIVFLIFLFLINNIFGQHEDIIFEVPSPDPVYFKKGTYYWIDWETRPGNAYLVKDGIKVSNIDNSGVFLGETDFYKIKTEVEWGANASFSTSGKITIVTDLTHIHRNRYNKVAKGALTKKTGDIFVDENGCEWELQSNLANKYHDPCNNVKLLHKVAGGGEYETIRILMEDEKYDTHTTITGNNIPLCGIKISTTKLKGENLTTGSYQSSYNFGQTSPPYLKHRHLDMKPHNDGCLANFYTPTAPKAFLKGCQSNPNPPDPTNPNPTTPQSTASTLFLFDLSGSMNSPGKSGQSKLKEAKFAADATLTSIANDSAAGIKNEVCVMGFQGSCSSPISINTGFKNDLASIKTDVNNLRANGGTPLVEAIEIAECELVKQINLKGQSTGKLIILSDGKAGCQKIRPDETYIYGQTGKLTKTILPNSTCGGDILAMREAGSGAKYYTIGFNIAPGSSAERDLQYLAQASSGKYLNVQSRDQLEKAFKKFNRTYIPKPNPMLGNLPPTATGQFKQGVTEIMAESFLTALATCEFFVKSHPKDCHGVYNLALMQEANDLFLDAAKSYETYLSLCPAAKDKEYVGKQIKRLEEERRQYILFQKQVIISDLEYLKAYYQSLFNTRNEVLAKEFKGFIKEKANFYANLPKILSMENEQWLIDASKDLSRGFKRTAKSVDDPDFDRMAVSLLTFPIETLEGIVEELKKI